MISRRAFAGGLAAALGTGPFPAYAQQRPAGAKPYRVGVLNEAFGPNPPVVLGLKAGLVELGLQEGRDVVFETVLTRGQLFRGGTHVKGDGRSARPDDPDVVAAASR